MTSWVPGPGGGGAGEGFDLRPVVPVVLDVEPAKPAWVGAVRRAELDEDLVAVEWVRRPSSRFADQVVQSLLVRGGGRTELNPPVVFPGELPEIVGAEDWFAYAVLVANVAGILGSAQEATRTIHRTQRRGRPRAWN
ncbi:MAG: hypothetical protein ACRCYQ_02000 [Nocardioides sp.]